VGLQIAKAVWAKKNNPELSLGEAYAEGSNKYEENKEEIIEINKKIYGRSNEEINKIYDEGRKESLGQFESLYRRLDSKFDSHFYESESGEVGKKLVLENVGKVFEESEGAVIFRGENFEPKTHTRVFLNKEGLPTYEAKELGLAKIKRDTWPDYDKSITVTANEQDSFFNVVEVAIGEVFPELKNKLTHLSHGMIKLPSGKMSSRTGDIITAESLIDQVKEKIKEKIDDDKIIEEIAIGAIKYTILRQAIGGDIVFDFDKSISFEGDSGPYLQYTAVRAKSVLEKAKMPRVPLDTEVKPPENWETTELERTLYKFPEIMEIAGKEYAPHKILSYLIDLASTFNSFYANHKIIAEGDDTSPYKLAITSAVATILKNGLYLLGIKVPERM
jgi:arginyl-tRNA synthetase